MIRKWALGTARMPSLSFLPQQSQGQVWEAASPRGQCEIPTQTQSTAGFEMRRVQETLCTVWSWNRNSLFVAVSRNCLWGLQIWSTQEQRALLAVHSSQEMKQFLEHICEPGAQEVLVFSSHFFLGCFHGTSRISHWNYIDKAAHHHSSLLQPIREPELLCEGVH